MRRDEREAVGLAEKEGEVGGARTRRPGISGERKAEEREGKAIKKINEKEAAALPPLSQQNGP